ncbi:PTS sugar transporter subunit IIC [Enterococcus saccharolyticus]|uniref:PTS sugar transporter subunit IIC n=1 Tax=Enterococcus TaxID=1350 RepID=UPI001E48C028|nr:PTS transporter subunit EIIC [Enterococcus saccharolyticus]MCD5003543.1 PTS sugar transporter subunit IIC [Enterococcus saccharolyticus]
MNAFIQILEEKFAPKLNKFAENRWIQTISSGIMLVLPVIFLGSLISIYNIIRLYVTILPDIQPIYDFSFGLYSLILSFLVGYQGMDKFRHAKYKLCTGIIGLVTFLMMIKPDIVDGVITIEFSRLGPKGILIAFVSGLLGIIITHLYAKWDPFANNTTIPEFLTGWINQIIPTFIALLIAMILTYTLNLDVFELVTKLFSPINSFGQTLPGFLLICFVPAVFYSLGISSWLLSPVYTPIMLEGIAQNIDNVAAGLPAVNIVTQETVFVGFVWLGGMGATLPLVLLMMKAKSKKLRVMGKIYLIPSLFNINEPVIFGTPVAFNPYLMPPMWINGIVGPLIVWLFMKSGWVNVPAKLLTGVKLPMPISSFLTTEDWRAVILWGVLLLVYGLIWYPFFKAYDKQLSENNVA